MDVAAGTDDAQVIILEFAPRLLVMQDDVEVTVIDCERIRLSPAMPLFY